MTLAITLLGCAVMGGALGAAIGYWYGYGTGRSDGATIAEQNHEHCGELLGATGNGVPIQCDRLPDHDGGHRWTIEDPIRLTWRHG